MRDCGFTVRNLRQRIIQTKPSTVLRQLRQLVRDLDRRIYDCARARLKEERAALKTLSGRLGLLSPLNVLSRGYSITSDADTGRILRNARDVQPGQKIQTRLKTGTVRSVVEDSQS
jgi:exodeoxyribonuclease VII large subunit